jgi:hypothetical protein
MSNVVLTADSGNGEVALNWNLTGDASGATRGELIINDDIKDATKPLSGFQSIPISSVDMGKNSTTFTSVNGVKYSIVLIVYKNNASYKSAPLKITPTSGPQVPIISCEGGNTSVRITILNYSDQPGVTNGFSVNTHYDVFYGDGESQRITASSSLSLTGLSNGTTYEIAVRAVNPKGVSGFSLTSVVTPSSKPFNVTNFTANVKDRAVLLTWTPDSNMAADSMYKISKKLSTSASYDAEVDFSKMVTIPAVPATDTTSEVPAYDTPRIEETIGGLDNGSAYDFKIRVVNPTSGSSETDDELNKTPFGRPGVPQQTTTVESQKITIKLCKPTNNNGKDVTSYILRRFVNNVEQPTSLPGSAIDPSGCQTFVITSDLTNGIQYSFNAYAVNDTNSISDALLIYATPYGVPGPVTALSAVGADEKVTLTWVAPVEKGGSQSLMYRVTYQYQTSAAGVSPVTYATETMNGITAVSQMLTNRLLNGVSTTFNVFAYFTVDGREYTSSLASVPCVPFKAPNAPSVTVNVNTDNNLSYSWSEPNLYNLPFEKYEYKLMLSSNPNPEGVAWVELRTTALTNTLVLPPVINGGSEAYGVSHKLLIKTVTKNGSTLVPSAVTEILKTPYKPPSPVLNMKIYPKKGKLDVFWDPPADFGGYTIIKYKVVVDGDTSRAPYITEKVTITDLLDRQEYVINVAALGYIGEDFTQQSSVVTQTGIPYASELAAPTNLTAVASANNVVLTWIASPAQFTQYAMQYVVFRGSDDTEIGNNITDLTFTDYDVQIGKSYTYRVMAKQIWDSKSTTSYSPFTGDKTASPYTNPAQVKNLNLLAADRKISVNWTALLPEEKNGLTDTVFYDIVVKQGNTQVASASPSGVTTYEFNPTNSSLLNGTTYTVEIRARIRNLETGLDVLSSSAAIASISVNVKPLSPKEVTFTEGDGKITVEWFGADSDSYVLKHYEIVVVSGATTLSYLDAKSVTKNKVEIGSLTNGTSYEVKIRRVATLLGDSTEQVGDYISNGSLIPFGAPEILNSSQVDATNKKMIKFNIRPNGSALSQIAVLAYGNTYTNGDEVFKQVAAGSSAISGTVTQDVSFAISQGDITSFLAIVVNARGKMTVYRVPA